MLQRIDARETSVAANVSTRLAKVENLERKASHIVEMMLDAAEKPEGVKLSQLHRMRATTLRSALDYFRYMRELHRRETQHESDEDELAALPVKDLEKVVAVGIKILGAQRVKDLAS